MELNNYVRFIFKWLKFSIVVVGVLLVVECPVYAQHMQGIEQVFVILPGMFLIPLLAFGLLVLGVVPSRWRWAIILLYIINAILEIILCVVYIFWPRDSFDIPFTITDLILIIDLVLCTICLVVSSWRLDFPRVVKLIPVIVACIAMIANVYVSVNRRNKNDIRRGKGRAFFNYVRKMKSEESLERELLIRAIKANNMDAVKYQLETISAAKTNRKSKSELLLDVVKTTTFKEPTARYVRMWLLENGANVNYKDSDGWTLLHHAVSKGGYVVDYEEIKWLLDAGANVNIADDRNGTPLFYLDIFQEDILKLLLDYGANPNLVTNYDQTVLDNMMSFAAEKQIEILRSYGAKTASELKSQRATVQSGRQRGTKAFQQQVTPHDKSRREIVPPAVASRLTVSKQDVKDEKELQYKFIETFTYSHIQRIQIEQFLEAGADVNKPDVIGRTPLHEAVSKENAEAVKCLLEHGAIVYPATRDLANYRGNEEIIGLLKSVGAKKRKA